MLRPLKNKESGIVLVTVIIISLIMAILAIGILSINTSQVKSSEQIKRDMIAEFFARMVYWEIQANSINNLNIASSVQKVINNLLYTANIYLNNATSPASLNIVVTY